MNIKILKIGVRHIPFTIKRVDKFSEDTLKKFSDSGKAGAAAGNSLRRIFLRSKK